MSDSNPHADTIISVRPRDGGCAGGRWGLRFVFSPDAALIDKEVPLSETLTLGRIHAGPARPNWRGIADRRVSGEHLTFDPGPGGRLLMKDHESRNGTFVNGARARSMELAECDVIKLGSTLAVVTCRADEGRFPNWWSGPLARWTPSAAFRETLRQLDRSDATLPAVLVGEVGTGKKALLKVLAQRRFGPARKQLAIVDGANVDEGMITALTADRADEVLVIDGLERLHVRVQLGLARAIEARVDPVLGAVMGTSYAPLAETGLDASFIAALAGSIVTVPPLRRRKEELLSLAGALVPMTVRPADAPTADDRPFLDLSGAEALLKHDWPGNVRELERCVGGLSERSVRPYVGDAVREELGLVTRITLGTRNTATPPPRPMVSPKLRPRPTKAGLVAAIAAVDGDLEAAARSLGVERQQILRWLEDDATKG